MSNNISTSAEQEQTVAEPSVAKPKRMGKKQRKQAHIDANWGGKREGAGRKCEGVEKKVAVGFSISETAKAQRDYLKDKGVNPSLIVEEALKNAALAFGWSDE